MERKQQKKTKKKLNNMKRKQNEESCRGTRIIIGRRKETFNKEMDK